MNINGTIKRDGSGIRAHVAIKVNDIGLVSDADSSPSDGFFDVPYDLQQFGKTFVIEVTVEQFPDFLYRDTHTIDTKKIVKREGDDLYTLPAIVLDLSLHIEVRITGHDGESRPDATVALLEAGHEIAPPKSTDSDGKCLISFDAKFSGRQLAARATAQHYKTREEPFVGGQQKTITIKLEKHIIDEIRDEIRDETRNLENSRQSGPDSGGANESQNGGKYLSWVIYGSIAAVLLILIVYLCGHGHKHSVANGNGNRGQSDHPVPVPVEKQTPIPPPKPIPVPRPKEP